MNDIIFDFLKVSRPDNCGRMISDIWNYSYEKIETTHNYIQWLFPLFERSAFSTDAPILTVDLAEQIYADEICKSSLNRSLSLMRSFYGNNSHWANPSDHNLLRITRILKSSALLLGKACSIEFYKFIMLRCNELEFKPLTTTIDYWNEATTVTLAQYRA